MVGEAVLCFLEHHDDVRVNEPVVHRSAVFFAGDDPRLVKDEQVLGDVLLGAAHRSNQRVDSRRSAL